MTGVYSATIGPDGALKIPSPMRRDLAVDAVTCWQDREFPNMLCVSSVPTKVLIARMKSNPPFQVRELPILDGKLALPPEYCSLFPDRDVVLAGIGLIIEIFRKEDWMQFPGAAGLPDNPEDGRSTLSCL